MAHEEENHMPWLIGFVLAVALGFLATWLKGDKPRKEIETVTKPYASSSAPVPSLYEQDVARRRAEAEAEKDLRNQEEKAMVEEFMVRLQDYELNPALILEGRYYGGGDIAIQVADSWFDLSEEERKKVIGRCQDLWFAIWRTKRWTQGADVRLYWGETLVGESVGAYPYLR